MGSVSSWLYTSAVSPVRAPLVVRNRNLIKPNINKPNTRGPLLHIAWLMCIHVLGKGRSRTPKATRLADFLLQVKSRQSISTDKGQDSGCLCGQGY